MNRFKPYRILAAILLAVVMTLLCPQASADDGKPAGMKPLFDGKTLSGWEGNTDWFRVEDAAIVGGSLKKKIPRNEFLCTAESYENFELRLEFKLLGGGVNAGVQLRSKRVPNHHEVSGYQADLGDLFWGCLYDESRRNRVLTRPADEPKLKAALRREDWNQYRIRCEGPRIRLWINDVPTVDYTETESDIPRRGIIGLQIHAGPASEAWYRAIELAPLE